MKTFKKIVVLLLSIALLAMVFVGCKKTEDDGTKVETPQKSEEEAEESSENTETAAPEPVDYGKIVVVIPDWGGTMDNEEENAIVLEELNKRLLEDKNMIAELDFQSYPGPNFEEKLNVLLAGNEQLDAFSHWYPWNGFLKYATKTGLVMELDELIDNTEYLKTMVSENNWTSVTHDGKIKAIPDVMYGQTYSAYIRKDILDVAGVPVPTTLEELETALQVLKEAGVVPVYEQMQNINRWLAGSFGVPFSTFIDENGMIMDRTFHPNYVKYLQTVRDWYVKGYMPQDFLTANLDNAATMFQTGKTGTIVAWYSNIEGMYPPLKEVYPEAEVSVLQPIDTGYGDPGVPQEETTKNIVFILNSSDKGEAIIQFVDWRLSNTVNDQIVSFGVPDTHFTIDVENMTKEATEKYKDPGITAYGSIYTMGLWYPALFEPFNSITDVPEEIRAQELTNEALDMLESANKIFSPTVGLPVSLDDDTVTALDNYSNEISLVIALTITGEITIDDFIAERQRLYDDIYKTASEAYTAKYNEFMGN